MKQRTHVVARVKLTVEIHVGDSWDTDCRMAQIQEQATRMALGALEFGIDLRNVGEKKHATVIGEPTVTAVIVSDE